MCYAEPTAIGMTGFDQQRVEDYVISECGGLQSCNLIVDVGDFYSPGSVLRSNEQTYFYVQASCQPTEEVLNEKRKLGLAISSFGILNCLLFISLINYSVINLMIREKVWDIKLLTVSDYTLKMDIRSSTFYFWKA